MKKIALKLNLRKLRLFIEDILLVKKDKRNDNAQISFKHVYCRKSTERTILSLHTT